MNARPGAGLAALLVTLAMLVSACAPASPAPSPRDERSARPTIVSLNPCLDAILVEIARPGQILALSHYSRNRASSSIPADIAARYPVTGGTAEEVIALDPDIVLASRFLDPVTLRAFERVGLETVTFASPQSVEESIAQVRRVAEVIAASERAEKLVARIEGGPARASAGNRSISTVLWQPGQIVPGGQTLIGELMREQGLASHSEAIGLGQADHLALETMLADPPDLLLISGDSRGQAHPLLGELSTTRVEQLAPNLLYCGGPTIPQVRRRLSEIRAEIRGGEGTGARGRAAR